MQVWQYLRPKAPSLIDITFIVLTIVYNLTAHSIVVSSIVTFNLFPVPAVVLSIEQVGHQHASIGYMQFYNTSVPYSFDSQ